MTDGTESATVGERGPLGLPRWVGALIPLVLLGLVIVGFLTTPPFAGVQSGAPLPDVTISHVTLPDQYTLILHVTNNGPAPVTISQVLVADAYWDFQVAGNAAPGGRLAPLESAQIAIPYHWQPGWDLEVALVLTDGATIHHTIVAPFPQPGLTPGILWTLAVIGIFVGVIPVALGMLWFPYLETMSDRALHAVLAFSAGILAFLAFDAGFEAFELVAEVPGAFEGPLLVVLGILGSLLAVQAVMDWRMGGRPSALSLAYAVALGIGLHNLAEGLAIGSAFALGRVSLGAFLVVGFMIHNVTEGPAVVAPLARGDRPALLHFVALGALAGAPAILGGWIGGAAYSPTLGALFLAIGVGAILQVVWDIGDMIRSAGSLTSATNLVGFGVGLAVMYVTDLFVAL